MFRSVGRWIASQGLKAGSWGMQKVKSNKTLYGLAYELKNRDGFTNLYQHEMMLSDRVRVDFYAAAIRHHVRPGQVVVDLGTGSGILAMLAARQGAKVIAIDHSDFIKVAEENARRNNVTGIEFVQANSKDFHPDEKVDIILHEQIGDDLFNENMVENLLELKSRILKPGGLILPGGFDLFMEPVSLMPEYRVPLIEEIKVQGFDFTLGAEAAHVYRSGAYLRRFIEPAGVNFFLGEPQPILSVDLNTLKDPSKVATVVQASRAVTRPGIMDGFQQYFGIDFGGGIYFDTSPKSPRTCWVNRFFRTPLRDCKAGDTIDFTLTMGHIKQSQSWKVTLDKPKARVSSRAPTGELATAKG